MLYVAACTQLDLAFIVWHIAQFMANPGRLHWSSVKWIFCYLKHTQYVHYQFKGSSPTLEGWADADWVSDSYSKKSKWLYFYV